MLYYNNSNDLSNILKETRHKHRQHDGKHQGKMARIRHEHNKRARKARRIQRRK